MTMVMLVDYDSDNATLQELQPWKAGIQSMANDIVGRSLVRLEGNFLVCRRKECNLGQY